MDYPWLDPQLVAEALEKRADPEITKRGRAWVAQGRVRDLVEEETDDGLVVHGKVLDGGEVLHPALTLSAARVDGECACGARPWPCVHLLAVARSWSRSGPGQVMQAMAGGGRGHWRRLLSALSPGGRRVIASGPDGSLVHWLDVRPATPMVWTLAVSWRLHRTTGRGMGRGKRFSPEDLLAGGGPEVPEAERRIVRTVLACAAVGGEAGDNAVVVAADAVDVALRALAGAEQVRWEGVRTPVMFDLQPVRVSLSGQEQRGGLALELHWEAADGSRWQPEELRVLGSRFPWVENGGVLYPVATAGDGAALAILARRGVEVPAADLPALLGSVVPALENSGVAVTVSGLEGREFVVSPVPRPRLYLSEEAGNLVATLAFTYGDYEIPAEVPESVVGVGAGKETFVRRDMEEEFHAVTHLREFGFRMTDAGRFELEGEDAYDFLLHRLDELSAQWEVFGRGELRRYRVSSTPVSLRVRLAAGMDWLDLSLEAEAEDDDELPVAEVLRALRRGSRYVRLGSGAHALLPEEWGRRLSPILDTLGVGSRSVRVPHYLAPLVEEVAERVPLRAAAGEEAWQRLQSVLRGTAEVPSWPPPEGLQATLRPYQLTGYRWLRFMGEVGFGCILADDMGLGKTVQALALLLSEKAEGRGQPSLVVAPTSVVPNWEAEARRFAPSLRVVRHHGVERREKLDTLHEADLVITSYAVLRRDIEALSEVKWNYAVLDEAQAIKNAATQTARAARRLVARRRLTLTGTPLENHLGELWSQFQFLMPGLLGSEARFAREFARPIVEGDTAVLATLRRRIRPFTLRRLKSEVARDLPEKVESVLLCEMGEEQQRLYRTLLAASRERVLQEVERKGLPRARFSVLEALLRLRQACCLPEILPGGVGDGVPSAKFDLFCEFVSEVVAEGHRILVFSQFVKVLTVLRRWFEAQEISHLYLDGRTRNREERVRRFQEDETVAAFLVSLKAGGAGLNLTGADYVILFDPWWNPAVETQATDRAHRIGQHRKVFAYKMITRDSVEEKILQLQDRKRDLTEKLIESEGTWGDSLTEEDLKELFSMP